MTRVTASDLVSALQPPVAPTWPRKLAPSWRHIRTCATTVARVLCGCAARNIDQALPSTYFSQRSLRHDVQRIDARRML
jgi:hypothetical protein